MRSSASSRRPRRSAAVAFGQTPCMQVLSIGHEHLAVVDERIRQLRAFATNSRQSSPNGISVRPASRVKASAHSWRMRTLRSQMINTASKTVSSPRGRLVSMARGDCKDHHGQEQLQRPSLLRPSSSRRRRLGTVPPIVPARPRNSVSRANGRQLARSWKWGES